MTIQKTKDKRIRTIGQLKELTKADNGLNCYILLNGGLKSSKHMVYYDGVYCGDWSILGTEVFEKSQFQVSAFPQDKARLPENPNP